MKLDSDDNQKFQKFKTEIREEIERKTKLESDLTESIQKLMYLSGKFDYLSEDLSLKYQLDKNKKYDIQDDGTIKLQ